MFDNTKKYRFNNIKDIRRFLARLINESKSKKMTDIEIKQLRGIGYLCGLIISAIKDSDIENRIKLLEDVVNDRGLKWI